VPLDPRSVRGCGTIGGVPAAPSPEPIETCPGCGAVLAPVADGGAIHPGASASCARLFEDTLRGLREEAATDAATAAVLQQADDAYDAQHATPADPGRLRTSLERLGASLERTGVSGDAPVPQVWRTTIADVAADLDVIDLPVLVESWARSVHEDWTATVAARS